MTPQSHVVGPLRVVLLACTGTLASAGLCLPSCGLCVQNTAVVNLLWSCSVPRGKGGRPTEVSHKWVHVSGCRLDHTAKEIHQNGSTLSSYGLPNTRKTNAYWRKSSEGWQRWLRVFDIGGKAGRAGTLQHGEENGQWVLMLCINTWWVE